MAVPKYPFPVVGGMERQSHELAKALIQRGHTVHAVSSRFDPGQNESEVIDGVQLHRVKWIEFRAARFLLFPFALARIFFRIRSDVDLVHAHNVSWFGTFVTLLAKVSGLPAISKLPNSGEFGIPGIRRRPFGCLHIALVKCSDAIIAMTPESVAELAGIGFSRARVLNVTNGIALSPAPLKGPPSSETVSAIYVGRLSPEKGLSDLLHAWRSVKVRTTRPIKLSILGGGAQAAELRALAIALNVGEEVQFLGHCDNVSAELAKAHLFVLPSYAEGNSNAILEAMSAGLPIVATRIGGAALQIGRDGERFLISPGDREALADGLLALIEDETLRRRLGAAMRARIERVFSIDRIAAIYEQAYELLVSGRREQIGRLNSTLVTKDTPCAG